MLSNIPTNIITGFLGVGKTTALNYLISQKPDHETWAIVVNEFGKIGIDQTAIDDKTGLAIKEIAGGCVCCALGPALTMSLAMLIRRTRPDRVIIEPTGLGHPEGLIDIIQSESFKEVLDLRSIICLLDPRVIDQPEVLGHSTFIDQLNLADIIILNKCDLASEQQITAVEQRALAMFPPKSLVTRTHQGQLSLSVLNQSHNFQHQSDYPEAHHSHTTEAPKPNLYFPKPNVPIKQTGSSSDAYSCGWVFHQDDLFDHEQLLNLIKSFDSIWRLKGVFNVGNQRIFYNRVLDETSVQPIAWRRDSRIEIISEVQLDWETIESALCSTIIAQQPK